MHVGFSFPRPPLLARRLSSLTTFFAQAHQILNLLLLSLSSSLQLPPTTSLTNLHRSDAPSLDILRLLHYIAQPPSETGASQAPHTDLGSLTLLFAKSPGFQVMPPNGTKWKFVVPTTGCAIVNIGDGMSRQGPGFLPRTIDIFVFSPHYPCLCNES